MKICFVITALGATIFVGWVLKDKAMEEITNGNTIHGAVYNLWYQAVRYVIPVVILAIFVYGLSAL